MSIINHFSVVIDDFLITSNNDKLSVSIEIGIVWLVISSMSFLIAKVISKASAKAIARFLGLILELFSIYGTTNTRDGICHLCQPEI